VASSQSKIFGKFISQCCISLAGDLRVKHMAMFQRGYTECRKFELIKIDMKFIIARTQRTLGVFGTNDVQCTTSTTTSIVLARQSHDVNGNLELGFESFDSWALSCHWRVDLTPSLTNAHHLTVLDNLYTSFTSSLLRLPRQKTIKSYLIPLISNGGAKTWIIVNSGLQTQQHTTEENIKKW